MDGLVLRLLVAAAAFAVGLSAPAREELAEIERILAETKDNHRMAAAEGIRFTFEHPFKKSSAGTKKENDPWMNFDTPSSSWNEKMGGAFRSLPYPQLPLHQNNREDIAEKEQLFYYNSPQPYKNEEVKEEAEKEWGYLQAALEDMAEKQQQWGGYGWPISHEKKDAKGAIQHHHNSKHPQGHKNEKVEEEAEKEQWGVYGWPTPREQGKLAREEKIEQLGSIQHHHNSRSRDNGTRFNHSSSQYMRNRSVYMMEFLDGQTERMQDFIKAQTRRTMDFMNQSTTFMQRERNLTAEFMKQERKNTLAFLHGMPWKQGTPEVRMEFWGGSDRIPPPSTILREATSIRIPIGSRPDAMETARIQGFLRRIAPFILKKLNG